MRIILNTLALLFAGALILVALLFRDFEEYKKVNTVRDFVEKFKSLQILNWNIENRIYRTAIATSYCNVLKEQNEIKVEEYNECIHQYNDQPADLYEALTGNQLGESWSELASIEQRLIVQEAKEVERRIILDIKMKELLK